MQLKDKVVVITGGSRGFGLELAHLFEKEGSKIVVLDNVCDVPHGDKNIYSFSCDITEEKDVATSIKNVLDKYKTIDIWVNNAGIWIPHTNLEDINIDDAKKVMDVNVLGTFLCTKHIIPLFKSNGGTIMNIISTSALGPRPTTSIYSASKYAVNGLTQAVRKELEGYNIKVYSVFPGAMKTNIFKDGVPDDFDTYMDAESVAKTVLDNLKKDNPDEELIIKKD